MNKHFNGPISLYTDVSQRPLTTAGYVIADRHGTIDARAEEIPSGSNDRGEVTALVIGLQRLLERDLAHARIMVRTDCWRVLEALHNPKKPVNKNIGSVVKKLRMLSCQFDDLTYEWVPHQLNVKAHHTAKYGPWLGQPTIITPLEMGQSWQR